MDDPPIDMERAERIMTVLVDPCEQALTGLVKVPLNQYQVDALLLFMYNVGVAAFAKSTLLKRINVDPLHEDIPKQFMRWIYDNGHRIPGLIKRRRIELNLYYSAPDDTQNNQGV